MAVTATQRRLKPLILNQIMNVGFFNKLIFNMHIFQLIFIEVFNNQLFQRPQWITMVCRFVVCHYVSLFTLNVCVFCLASARLIK